MKERRNCKWIYIALLMTFSQPCLALNSGFGKYFAVINAFSQDEVEILLGGKKLTMPIHLLKFKKITGTKQIVEMPTLYCNVSFSKEKCHAAAAASHPLPQLPVGDSTNAAAGW